MGLPVSYGPEKRTVGSELGEKGSSTSPPSRSGHRIAPLWNNRLLLYVQDWRHRLAPSVSKVQSRLPLRQCSFPTRRLSPSACLRRHAPPYVIPVSPTTHHRSCIPARHWHIGKSACLPACCPFPLPDEDEPMAAWKPDNPRWHLQPDLEESPIPPSQRPHINSTPSTPRALATPMLTSSRQPPQLTTRRSIVLADLSPRRQGGVLRRLSGCKRRRSRARHGAERIFMSCRSWLLWRVGGCW